jgi:creatinine amidohydrolase/Fe(II)-dependent formamide hydrolase-like protein
MLNAKLNAKMNAESKPVEGVMPIEKLWPKELLYFRRMGSREISDFLENTPAEKRVILITWGVLEAHGPWLAVANDSAMAQVATDKVANLLYKNHSIQPIIFNSFIDIGSYSATRDFPGAVAIEGWQEYKPGNPSPIVHVWEEVIKRLKKEGFGKFFLINGDGGNWMNYMERSWEEGFRAIKDDIQEKQGVLFDGTNWDQEGGYPWKHAGHHEHAFINWLCLYAPEFERLSAARHGLKPVSEENLKTIDGASFGNLEDEERRRSNWAKYPGQDRLRAVTEFSFQEYKKLLYENDGITPLKVGGIAADFEAKIKKLMEKVLKISG